MILACDSGMPLFPTEGLTFFLVKSVKTGRSLERELLNLANVSFHTVFIACIMPLICFVTVHVLAAHNHDDVMLYSI